MAHTAAADHGDLTSETTAQITAHSTYEPASLFRHVEFANQVPPHLGLIAWADHSQCVAPDFLNTSENAIDICVCCTCTRRIDAVEHLVRRRIGHRIYSCFEISKLLQRPYVRCPAKHIACDPPIYERLWR